MSETTVTHPVWCDPSQCTAPAERPIMGQDWSKAGEHRSAPVCGSWGGLAYLTQAVAPWECSVYLKFEPNGSAEAFSRESFELEPESPLLLMIRQHVADQQARYPSLVPPLEECALCAGFQRSLSNPVNEAERKGIEDAYRLHRADPHRIWKEAPTS